MQLPAFDVQWFRNSVAAHEQPVGPPVQVPASADVPPVPPSGLVPPVPPPASIAPLPPEPPEGAPPVVGLPPLPDPPEALPPVPVPPPVPVLPPSPLLGVVGVLLSSLEHAATAAAPASVERRIRLRT